MAVKHTRPTAHNRTASGSAWLSQPYVHGSTAPQLKPEAFPEKKKRSAGRVKQRQIARRNQEKAMGMDLPYVFVLLLATAFTLNFCVNYLHLHSSITARMHSIEKMEADLERLRASNDALEASINTSIDLNHVYDVATRELGMVYANKNQVLLYDKAESEYVRQYEDIPQR